MIPTCLRRSLFWPRGSCSSGHVERNNSWRERDYPFALRLGPHPLGVAILAAQGGPLKGLGDFVLFGFFNHFGDFEIFEIGKTICETA